METTRQKKVSRLIQKELSLILSGKFSYMLNNAITSITIVRISIDLAYANIFISVFPSKEAVENLRVINENKIPIRKELAMRVRHQLRIIPELQFHLDDSGDYYEEINQLLKK